MIYFNNLNQYLSLLHGLWSEKYLNDGHKCDSLLMQKINGQGWAFIYRKTLKLSFIFLWLLIWVNNANLSMYLFCHLDIVIWNTLSLSYNILCLCRGRNRKKRLMVLVHGDHKLYSWSFVYHHLKKMQEVLIWSIHSYLSRTSGSNLNVFLFLLIFFVQRKDFFFWQQIDSLDFSPFRFWHHFYCTKGLLKRKTKRRDNTCHCTSIWYFVFTVNI
jgi:hypothetical protein